MNQEISTMASTTATLRHEGVGAHSWIAMAITMLALALGCGYTLAMGELVGLYVALSLACGVAVLFDFRAGAVLLLLLLPFSASALFPRTMLGISGLNPLNLLLLATMAAFLVHRGVEQTLQLLPKPLLWLFIVPVILAGLNGMDGVPRIPSLVYELDTIHYYTAAQYLIATVAKPMIMMAVALMIGAAATHSRTPERFIVLLAASAWLVALVQLGFVLLMGVPLATMATPGERSFYDPIGIHANSLGRIHMYAIALLAFVWAETKRPGLRLFMLVTLAVLSVALLLTFSRAAIAGAGIIGALFLLWKFNARTAALSLIGLILAAPLVGDVVYSRLTLGMGQSADAVSAGRIEGIWLPLLPEVAKSPLWGHGMSSILWSFPMQMGVMHPVGHAHSAYLETVLNMGLVGLGLVLAYYFHVWKGFRALSTDKSLSDEMRGLFQGAIAALVGFFITGAVGSTLTPDADTAYLWIVIGLMYGMLARRPAHK
jgi:O-antigen ligase